MSIFDNRKKKRSLPRFHQGGLTQFVTFRLADSLPRSVMLEAIAEVEDDDPLAETRLQFEALDRGLGQCILADRRCAKIVEEALLHFDGERYRLEGWVIMPNHVHVLVTVMPDWPLAKVVHSWKSFAASRINGVLGRRGVLWARDDFEHYIRCDDQFSEVLQYIEENPVKAGLCERSEEWLFSSARRRFL